LAGAFKFSLPEVIATPFLDITSLKKWVEDCVLFFHLSMKKKLQKESNLELLGLMHDF
jgi:hypothetical protein